MKIPNKLMLAPNGRCMNDLTYTEAYLPLQSLCAIYMDPV